MKSLILTVNHSSLYLPLVLGSAQSCQITLPIYIWYYSIEFEAITTIKKTLMSCDLQLELGSAHSCQIAKY
jgi:hypothetical protein